MLDGLFFTRANSVKLEASTSDMLFRWDKSLWLSQNKQLLGRPNLLKSVKK